MSHTSYPVSPILPSDTPVESGRQVRGDAGSGEADVEAADADTARVELEEEVLPQRPQASPEQPTASQIADHDLTHLHYRAWCPDCVEAFGRERAHHAKDPSGRIVPLIAVDYCFMSEKGIHLRDEVDYSWTEAPDDVLRLLAGSCSKSGDFFMHAVPKKGLDSAGYSAECLSKSIMALGHARCVVRSDNEPLIVQLVKATVGQVRLGGIDVVDEDSVPYVR